jgi:hypothetical protein
MMNGANNKRGNPNTIDMVTTISRETAFITVMFETMNVIKKINSIRINKPERNVNRKISLKFRLELKISLAADSIESTGGTLALFILASESIVLYINIDGT